MPRRDPEGRKKVLALAAQGVPPLDIVRATGKTKNAVYGLLWRDRNPHKAADRAWHRGPTFSRTYSFWVEQDMSDRIEAQRLDGQSNAALLRDIVAAGLDALEEGR